MAVTGADEPTALGSLDELIEGTDPYDCAACLAAGDTCEFHAGFAEGWDACAAFVARAIEADHGGEAGR